MGSLKREFLELLEKDLEFRYAVAGYLGLSEVLKRLDAIAEEQVRLREEQTKIWMEMVAVKEEQKNLREEQVSLRMEQTKIWSEIVAIKEEQVRLREEQTKIWSE
jgi:arginine/lysine/ornithine decarboxylase